MKNILASVYLLFTFSFLTAQVNLQWVQNIGGIDDERPYGIVLDAAGNVYTTGHFFGPTDFDPGIGNTAISAVGLSDVFISKLDVSGNLVWAKTMGGNSIELAFGIALDATNNVYVTGYFHDTADFDPGAGVHNLISQGAEDIFICKLDVNGNFVWAKSLGGSGNDIARSITVDGSGNVYTTGFFTDTADFDPGANVSLMVSGGNTDMFMSKLDANGNFVWAKQIKGTGHSEAYQIKLDAAGNIFTTGYFRDAEDFDPSNSNNVLTSVAGNDIFVAKYDANGNYLWAKQMGGTGYERARKLTLDAIGNIYVVGSFDALVDFDPGAGSYNLASYGMEDCFILKLNSSGNFVWAKRIGNSDFEEPSDITIDSNGNLFITGYFTYTVDFDAGIGITNLTSASNYSDAFITKYDSNGNFAWAKSFGGNGYEAGSAILLNSAGNIYVAGYYQYTVDFDPGTTTNNFTSGGGDDVFILKLTQVPAGINSYENTDVISIYPNPGNGIITIDSKEMIEEVTIRNVLGEIVTQSKQYKIDISKEAKGIYFVTVQTEKNFYTERVIVK